MVGQNQDYGAKIGQNQKSGHPLWDTGFNKVQFYLRM